MTEQETTSPHQPPDQSLPAQRALKALLGGKPAALEDIGVLTGAVRACIVALGEALEREGGVLNVHKAFNALLPDHPWLGKLAGMPNLDDPNALQEGEPPESRFRFKSLSEILNQPAQQWLIPGILPREGLALLYGESGGYKSFLVMDWSFCLATGTPWFGRELVRGPVAYFAAEGGSGLKKRSLAWLVHHQFFCNDPLEYDRQIPLRMVDDKQLVLQSPEHIMGLLTALQHDFPEPPVLVVIDTLSRSSAGADENNNTDMAKVLANADLIRQQLHCVVLLVHHEGKDKERGPRGASALTANIETSFLVTPDGSGGTRVESIKAKDASKFKPLYLEIQEVRYGTLPDEASLVLVPANQALLEEEWKEKQAAKVPDSQATILQCLQGKQMTYGELQQACIKAGQKENTFKAAFRALTNAKGVVKVGNYWQVPTGKSAQPPLEALQEETPEEHFDG
jgi:hypothetical protein